MDVFVPDIQKKFGWDRASIQWPSRCSSCSETWRAVRRWFVDKYGRDRRSDRASFAPRWMIKRRGHDTQRLYLGHDRPGIGAAASTAHAWATRENGFPTSAASPPE